MWSEDNTEYIVRCWISNLEVKHYLLRQRAVHTLLKSDDMISTTTKAAPVTLTVVDERMKVDGTDAKFGDWRDDLAKDGYAVIKGAIPRERADNYADKMYSWLESL